MFFFLIFCPFLIFAQRTVNIYWSGDLSNAYGTNFIYGGQSNPPAAIFCDNSDYSNKYSDSFGKAELRRGTTNQPGAFNYPYGSACLLSVTGPDTAVYKVGYSPELSNNVICGMNMVRFGSGRVVQVQRNVVTGAFEYSGDAELHFPHCLIRESGGLSNASYVYRTTVLNSAPGAGQMLPFFSNETPLFCVVSRVNIVSFQGRCSVYYLGGVWRARTGNAGLQECSFTCVAIATATNAPTHSPSMSPSLSPSVAPSPAPSRSPSLSPTLSPSAAPTASTTTQSTTSNGATQTSSSAAASSTSSGAGVRMIGSGSSRDSQSGDALLDNILFISIAGGACVLLCIAAIVLGTVYRRKRAARKHGSMRGRKSGAASGVSSRRYSSAAQRRAAYSRKSSQFFEAPAGESIYGSAPVQRRYQNNVGEQYAAAAFNGTGGGDSLYANESAMNGSASNGAYSPAPSNATSSSFNGHYQNSVASDGSGAYNTFAVFPGQQEYERFPQNI